MMKGIKFDNTHSFNDLNLVLSEVNIPPATPKTNYVDIPGGDGSLDLTESLGVVRFNDRECTFTFTVFPYDNFEEKKRQVSNLLNGKRCKITVDKDPGYFWDGRCSVNEYASDKNLHKIVLKATVAPYKLKNNATTVNVSAGTNKTVNLSNGRRPVVPTVKCSAETTIKFNGSTYTLNSGTHKVPNIQLVEGTNTLTVTSTSTVTFTYQEGDL